MSAADMPPAPSPQPSPPPGAREPTSGSPPAPQPAVAPGPKETRAPLPPPLPLAGEGRGEGAAPPLTFPAPTLRAWSTTCLQALGVPDTDARQIADSLVQTSLWGVDSHGIARPGSRTPRRRNERAFARSSDSRRCSASLRATSGSWMRWHQRCAR